MTYVTSNLHGNHAKFVSLLRAVNFKDTDILYVLGDIVDIGEEPMELICDMSMRYNVYCIAGEHDYLAARMLSGFERMLSKKGTPDAEYIADMNKWMEMGGKTTLDGYRSLDAEMKEGVLDYLSDMALYEEVTVKGKTYILVHSGLADLAVGGEGDCEPEEFFDTPVELGKKYFEDKTVIAGHIPTADANISRSGGTIAVDCGEGREGRVGCLRLEDGKEFYV